MKKITCCLLAVLAASCVYADSDRGLIFQLSTGAGFNNSIVNTTNNFNTDLGVMGSFGGKMDDNFGVMLDFLKPNVYGSNYNDQYNLDLLFNYYMETNNKWDVIWGLGVYYTNYNNGNVGAAGSISVNYNFMRDFAIVFTNTLYLNPTIPANPDFGNLLLNNYTGIGIRYLMDV